jgi:hypothetical protein
MNEKLHKYESDILALPPLKMVLGDVPTPDPRSGVHTLRAFAADNTPTQARRTVEKIIAHIEKK